ncbi:hypothetical protein ABKV19_021104 [Rosa sericea]
MFSSTSSGEGDQQKLQVCHCHPEILKSETAYKKAPMLIAILSSFMFTKQRSLVQIFPESARTLWSLWEIRVTVIVSLILQGILIVLGSRRKHSTSNTLRFILWVAYLSADWVATVSLSALSSSNATNPASNSIVPDQIITAFWAPFLLLHLGGPDTITASSLEDNELWWRHFLRLVVQVGVAIYVLLRAWAGHVLNFLAIPMFVAGFIKFAEKTWVLRSASSEHFRESMFPEPDPGPNYARYMNEFRSKKEEGFKVEFHIEDPKVGYHSYTAPEGVFSSSANLQNAHVLFFYNIFKGLFADLILNIDDVSKGISFFQSRSCDEAFKVIEIELGFMYDMLYTKSMLIYSVMGAILRFISFFCTISVSVAFLIVNKQDYSEQNVLITYILLGGAVSLEIYAVILLFLSDWTVLWLSKNTKAISCVSLLESKRWSNVIIQDNLINHCLEDQPSRCRFLHKVPTYKNLKKHLYRNSSPVEEELKDFIFQQLLKKSRSATKFEDLNKRNVLIKSWGEWVLEQEECLDTFRWSIEEEFDKSILLWHIATDLCYYSDLEKDQNFVKDKYCSDSRSLSNYMLYLLVMCPFMLPNGIGKIRFQDTCAEATEFFEERKCKGGGNASKELLKVSTEILPAKIKGDRSKSVLFDACRLSKALQTLQTDEKWEKKKWKLINRMWVEMLSYAASQCPWNQHARQLRRGGELVTHVWLLMAHFGLTEQLQISKGQARVEWNMQ